ncbi:hypothetical protein PLUA15_230252 [Pseudomonas lundensis]|uniref:Uncharacterized protein n=1 Tax=Pseudomonas lundensis TaxID=86185 RepID=A0AAX2H8A5_9PSED|nr:hypothetical protein PLUA15_230252 [Pseudomonas lundensis]
MLADGVPQGKFPTVIRTIAELTKSMVSYV